MNWIEELTPRTMHCFMNWGMLMESRIFRYHLWTNFLAISRLHSIFRRQHLLKCLIKWIGNMQQAITTNSKISCDRYERNFEFPCQLWGNVFRKQQFEAFLNSQDQKLKTRFVEGCLAAILWHSHANAGFDFNWLSFYGRKFQPCASNMQLLHVGQKWHFLWR